MPDIDALVAEYREYRAWTRKMDEQPRREPAEAGPGNRCTLADYFGDLSQIDPDEVERSIFEMSMAERIASEEDRREAAELEAAAARTAAGRAMSRSEKMEAVLERIDLKRREAEAMVEGLKNENEWLRMHAFGR